MTSDSFVVPANASFAVVIERNSVIHVVCCFDSVVPDNSVPLDEVGEAACDADDARTLHLSLTRGARV